jgi:hypothetical protein
LVSEFPVMVELGPVVEGGGAFRLVGQWGEDVESGLDGLVAGDGSDFADGEVAGGPFDFGVQGGAASFADDAVALPVAELAWAGRKELLFADDALAEIWQASRGYPRAVNNLATVAMVAAYAAGKAIVDKECAVAAVIDNTE